MADVPAGLEASLAESLDAALKEVAQEMPSEGFGVSLPSVASARKYVYDSWNRIRKSACELLRAKASSRMTLPADGWKSRLFSLLHWRKQSRTDSRFVSPLQLFSRVCTLLAAIPKRSNPNVTNLAYVLFICTGSRANFSTSGRDGSTPFYWSCRRVCISHSFEMDN